MFGLGPIEMLIVGVIAVLLFGNRLPEVGRSIGRSLMEFKKGMRDIQNEVDSAVNQPQHSQISRAVRPAKRPTNRRRRNSSRPLASRSMPCRSSPVMRLCNARRSVSRRASPFAAACARRQLSPQKDQSIMPTRVGIFQAHGFQLAVVADCNGYNADNNGRKQVVAGASDVLRQHAALTTRTP